MRRFPHVLPDLTRELSLLRGELRISFFDSANAEHIMPTISRFKALLDYQ